ncbi:hypothetical protein E0H73_33335 [Kribbella pittospori]|uniref:Uncharacterized protein n=1 Tax=Kribbella pittospori TaxID=722689 RepID=A0A4R0KB10_9ACTN|nr:hypothetical protein [Kribbella pittospori]TCC56557.1 hypothetical protein E0H73_33335 [Kribbella pittospori]
MRRQAGLLLGLGLVCGLGWAIAVSTSMPSWFDPSEACAKKLHGGSPDHTIDVHTSWFPPSASCDFGGGDVRQYMSTTRSTVLSVLGVLILVVLVTGLVLTIKRLAGEPGPTRLADGVDLRRRKRNQLTFGALDVLIAVAVLVFFNAVAIVLGEIVGGVLFVVTTIAGLSALCTALDRHMGPLPSTALESRRRGTATGAILFGVIFTATAVTGQLPFFRLWAAPLAAITYAAVVHLQWSRQRDPVNA